jgi:hypothetical protein
VAIGDQDHGRIAMTVTAVLASAIHQALDLALGEIASLDCQVYDTWCAFFGPRFHRNKAPFFDADWLRVSCTVKSRGAAVHGRRQDQPARRGPLSLRRAAPVTAGRATTGSAIGPTPAFSTWSSSSARGSVPARCSRISKELAMSLRGGGAMTSGPQLTNSLLGRARPPGRGTFHFEILVMPPLPKTSPKMVLSHKGVAFL